MLNNRRTGAIVDVWLCARWQRDPLCYYDYPLAQAMISAAASSPLRTVFTLGSDEVHIWRTELNQHVSQFMNLRDTLTADESARAARFAFQTDRDRFVVGRGVLRVLLSRYVGKEPSQLRFCYNPYGKPALTREFGGEVVRFNLSHSQGLALYVVTRDRQIGVDLERISPDLASDPFVKRFFSLRDAAALHDLPVSAHVETLFRCWTRKEAYVKARGEGLFSSSRQFDVSVSSSDLTALSSDNSHLSEASRWSLQDLDLGPGYAAALAVEGRRCRIRYRSVVRVNSRGDDSLGLKWQ